MSMFLLQGSEPYPCAGVPLNRPARTGVAESKHLHILNFSSCQRGPLMRVLLFDQVRVILTKVQRRGFAGERIVVFFQQNDARIIGYPFAKQQKQHH